VTTEEIVILAEILLELDETSIDVDQLEEYKTVKGTDYVKQVPSRQEKSD